MMTWALVVLFQGQKEPSVFLKPSEAECRAVQSVIVLENKRLGRDIESGCYVLTPTPESVTHPKARLVK